VIDAGARRSGRDPWVEFGSISMQLLPRTIRGKREKMALDAGQHHRNRKS
jgi:hypothetical protein